MHTLTHSLYIPYACNQVINILIRVIYNYSYQEKDIFQGFIAQHVHFHVESYQI